MWKFLFDSDWLQRSDIESLDERASALEQRLWRERHTAKEQAKALQHDLARALLVIDALGRLVVRKGLCTEDELAATIREVDLEDGVEDGVRTPARAAGECPQCGQKNPPRVARCRQCNAPLARGAESGKVSDRPVRRP